jgi:hypothetical protein
MRKALNLRDKGCVVCGAAPVYCDAHHSVSWLDGGPTSIDNLALFCRAHHIDVDNGHYTVTITDGVVHLGRPSWADPPPTPRPSTRHRPPGGSGGGPSVRGDDWGGSVWDDLGGTRGAGAGMGVGGEPIGRDDAVGKHLRPVRAHPLVGDPPPLVADPGFDPWGPETHDTG